MDESAFILACCCNVRVLASFFGFRSVYVRQRPNATTCNNPHLADATVKGSSPRGSGVCVASCIAQYVQAVQLASSEVVVTLTSLTSCCCCYGGKNELPHIIEAHHWSGGLLGL